MDRKEVLNLMQFVIDQNKNVFFETVNAKGIKLEESQLRVLLLALEEKTKESFFRVAERMDK